MDEARFDRGCVAERLGLGCLVEQRDIIICNRLGAAELEGDDFADRGRQGLVESIACGQGEGGAPACGDGDILLAVNFIGAGAGGGTGTEGVSGTDGAGSFLLLCSRCEVNSI